MIESKRSRVSVGMAVLCLGAGPWKCNGKAAGDPAEIAALAAADAGVAPMRVEPAPRREEVTTRERYAAARPERRERVTMYPEEVIVGVMRVGQSSFGACWRIAQRNDPTLTTLKAHVFLAVDAAGAVQSVRTDIDDDKLARCVSRVSRALPFPASGDRVELDLPLFF